MFCPPGCRRGSGDDCGISVFFARGDTGADRLQLQRSTGSEAADGYGWDGEQPICKPPVALTFSEV